MTQVNLQDSAVSTFQHGESKLKPSKAKQVGQIRGVKCKMCKMFSGFGGMLLLQLTHRKLHLPQTGSYISRLLTVHSL